MENFKTISNQLNKGSFSTRFNVIVLADTWCDKTVNENSLLDLENYYSFHQTRKNKKSGEIWQEAKLISLMMQYKPLLLKL